MPPFLAIGFRHRVPELEEEDRWGDSVLGDIKPWNPFLKAACMQIFAGQKEREYAIVQFCGMPGFLRPVGRGRCPSTGAGSEFMDTKRQTLVFAAAIGLACLAAAGCKRVETSSASQPSQAQTKGVQNPAAVMVEVNGAQLTRGELDRQVEEQYGQVAPMLPEAQADAFRRHVRSQIVENFIATTVLESEAEKRGIRVTDEDVTGAIAMISRNIPEGMTLESALEMQNMTMDEFRTRLRKDLRIKKLFDEEMEKAGAVTEADIQAFYEEHKASLTTPENVKARHILVQVEDEADEATKAQKKEKIEGLRKQIEEGADFAELAKANSDCPSAAQGGVLPPFGHGQMVPEFEEAAFTQAVGAIGPVIETQFGYHIVQVMERNAGQTRSLEESHDQIRDYLRMMKGRKIILPFIDTLKAKASVYIDPGLEAELKSARSAGEAEWEEDEEEIPVEVEGGTGAEEEAPEVPERAE